MIETSSVFPQSNNTSHTSSFYLPGRNPAAGERQYDCENRESKLRSVTETITLYETPTVHSYSNRTERSKTQERRGFIGHEFGKE